MKKTRNRLFAFLLTLVVFVSCAIPAYADPGDYYPYELPPNENPDVIYPEGNMTIVSDITGEAANQKEYLTVVTKNGNYFYIIIDRSADGENTVHFLNKVDESDLLSLMSEKEIQMYQQSQQPVATPTPTPTSIFTPTPTPDVTPDPSGNDRELATRATLILVLFVILGVLVFFYLRKNHSKADTRGNVNLDDYEFDDDEEEYFEAEKYDPEEEK